MYQKIVKIGGCVLKL